MDNPLLIGKGDASQNLRHLIKIFEFHKYIMCSEMFLSNVLT